MINIKSKGDELLETRLNEATNPLNPTLNVIATQAFCDQVLNEAEGHQIAVRLLAHKVQSPQEKEALYAFSVIDECIKKCGSRFHQEVGKFRFLNELIKVISPKYLALNMPLNVKKRCIECLYSLYKGLPHELKIAEAYNMLKKQNIITKDPTYLDDKIFKVESNISENSHSIFDNSKDAERLAKLLKSRNPDDLREANRIIKNIVQEDNQRIEMISKRTTEIETMKNNIKLLDEMLSHYEPGGATEDDLDIMKQLIENLEKSRADMFKLSRETDDNDILNDIIKVIDECNVIIKRYWDILSGKASANSNSKIKTNKNLIEEDLLGDSFPGSDDLLFKDLKSLGLTFPSEPIINGNNKSVPPSQPPVDAYQELLDIFPLSTNDDDKLNSNVSISFNYPSSKNNDLKNASAKILPKSQQESPDLFNKTKRPEIKGFEDLDILGKELLNIKTQKSDETLVKFNQINDVELLSSLQDKKTRNSSANDLPLLCNDLGFEQVLAVTPDSEHFSNSICDKETPEISTIHQNPSNQQNIESENIDLNSFNLSLSSIRPDPLKIPVMLYNSVSSKVKVMLHFSNDRPHPKVNVLVAQISSENENQVTEVILKFAISKPMKVHKQRGTTNVIQAHSPFTPSSPLNEIVLIYNPNNESVELKFHLSYEINGESFLESGHTGSIKF